MTPARARSSRQRYRRFVEDYKRSRLDETADTGPASSASPPDQGPPNRRRQYLREYLRWLFPYRYAVAAVFFYALLSAGMQMVEPLFMRYIIDRVLLNQSLDQASHLRRLHLVGATFLSVIVASALIGVLKDYRQRILNVQVETSGAFEIARRSRGTPRIANRLLCRARDYAQTRADGVITKPVADAALRMLDIDEKGLDEMDKRLLLALIEKFEGGPVGLGNLAAVISEEEDTIEEVYEPYLIQEGYLKRTPRGREATALAYHHFDRIRPAGKDPQITLL